MKQVFAIIFFILIIHDMSASKMSSLKFHFITYNVGTSSPDQDLHKLLRLSPDHQCEPGQFDFYVVGLQEVKAQIQNMLIDAIFEDPWTNKIKEILELRDYIKVKTIRLQGLLLNIFCLRKHLLYLRNIETQYTRTGLGGLWGNKGAVSIRFVLYGSSMCFVNAHLSAHDHMLADRIEDYHSILKENKFSAKVTTDILDHDYVFWFGDLNFRLMDEEAITGEYVAQQILRNQLSTLFEMDQLHNARITGAAFKEFTELIPKFKPTFKFIVGTSEYDMKRRPAWTDRIMYKLKSESFNNGTFKFEQLSYRSHEGYTMSDHKPVSSNFAIPITYHQYDYSRSITRNRTFKDNNSCPMDGDQVIAQDQESAVTFKNISIWKLDKENNVEYKINNDFEIGFEDWIGLYKDEFSGLDDYKEYMYVSNASPLSKHGEPGSSDQEVNNQSVNEFPVVNVITFPETSLHTQGLYRLIYFGVQDGSTSILGISDAFPARKED